MTVLFHKQRLLHTARRSYFLKELGVLPRINGPRVACGLFRDGLVAVRALAGRDADARRNWLPAARAGAHLDLGFFRRCRAWSEAHGDPPIRRRAQAPGYLQPTLHRRFPIRVRSMLRFGVLYQLAPHLPHLDTPVPGQYKVPVCPQLGQRSFDHWPPLPAVKWPGSAKAADPIPPNASNTKSERTTAPWQFPSC